MRGKKNNIDSFLEMELNYRNLSMELRYYEVNIRNHLWCIKFLKIIKQSANH